MVLDRIAEMNREAAADMVKACGNKAAPLVGSNGSYAPPVVASEPTTSVVVDGVLAVEYNSEIDRVKCEIAFHIDGADRPNMVAMLEGQGPQRNLIYFVSARRTWSASYLLVIITNAAR